MFVQLLILGGLLIWLLWYLIGKEDFPKNIPPGPVRLPIIGNLIQLAANGKSAPYEMFQTMSKTYGPVMFLQMGAVYNVVLDDYQQIKEVLTNDLWVDRYYNDWIAQRSFGKTLGILMISGGSWKEMRRFSMRTLRDFGFGKQKSMESTIQEELEEVTKCLQREIETGNNVVDMRQYFTVSILNVLWTMMAGFRFAHKDERLQKLLVLIDREIKQNAIGSVSGPMYLYSAFPILGKILPYFTQQEVERKEVLANLHGFFRGFLEERRALGDYKVEQRDYIDSFLREIDAHKDDPADTNYYTDEQFIVVAMDLFLAGAETTANTIEFAILYMILNPEVQRKVQAEIDAVIGTRPPSITDKQMMPYTEATLLEVQRRANVLPLVIRSPSQATYIGKHYIPKDTIGVINLYAMHMNEKTWKDPFDFSPSRFLDANNNVINAEKILPFGIGKRVCFGEILAKASLFTYFVTVLQRFSFEESPAQGRPSTEPAIGFTLSPQPYQALVKERSASS